MRTYKAQFSNQGPDGRLWWNKKGGGSYSLNDLSQKSGLVPDRYYEVTVDDNFNLTGWNSLPDASGGSQSHSGGQPSPGPTLTPQAPTQASTGSDWRVDPIVVSGVVKSLIEAGRVETTDDLAVWTRAAFLALSSAPSEKQSEPNW